MTAPITINGQTAAVTFDRFDLDAYRLFIECKRLPEKRVSYDWKSDRYTLTTAGRFAGQLGGTAPKPVAASSDLADFLFDYQRHFVAVALAARRYAFFWDCGLGKTPAQLEFGRQVNLATKGRFLHFAPLSVVPQTIKQAARFYGDNLPLRRLTTPDDLADFCRGGGDEATGIVNYEKLDAFTHDELRDLFRHLAGVSLDESGILKTGGGKRKWALIHGTKGVEFKLSNTATPAPNDAMEYASQCAFLEKLRSEGEILWTFFTRNDEGDWDVKPHARRPFYQFLSAISAYLRNPATYGFADNLATLIPPEWIEEAVAPTDTQMRLAQEVFTAHGSGLFGDTGLGITARQRLCQMARGFLYHGKALRGWAPVASHKPEAVARFVRQEMEAGRQVLVWTNFDAEADILLPLLPAGSAEVLDGRVKDLDERERIVERTERGDTPVLISKPSTMGFGRNLQQFSSMSFFGFDDSFERMYQAVRRAYRYGQTRQVRVHVPFVPELEGQVWGNVQQKAARFDEEATAMEAAYRDALGF